MTIIRNFLAAEPVRAAQLLRALLALAAAFGFMLAPAQVAAIMAVAALALDVKVSETVRADVTPADHLGD